MSIPSLSRRRCVGSLLLLHSPHPRGGHSLMQRSTFIDAKVKWVRDRALDHAVEKEKHLRPMHALKNLLLLRLADHHGPSPGSVPLSAVAERRDELRLPFRAIRFLRKYPSAFEEAAPPDFHHLPHIRPTKELLRLHEEERHVYESCKRETADRLLRLLMLTRSKSLPLEVIDRLRWDLGLPDDYVRTIIPDYPDYFQIGPSPRGGARLDLELVCWNSELAVSAMERVAMKTGGSHKGAPLAFPLQFSRGFDMEKKVKKWVEEWQKLPYISPYEDGSHLDPKSDLAEKWTVGVMHELLHLLVAKKTEKEDLLLLGECIGLRSGFKKVFVHHPGIFYVSNKISAHTVVLREAYRRDLLVEKHPLMGMRYQYIHLMRKSGVVDDSGAKKERKNSGKVESFLEEEEFDEDVEEEEEGDTDSDSEEEDESDDDEEDNAIEVKAISESRIARQPVMMCRPPRSAPSRPSLIERRLNTSKIPRAFSRKTRNA